VSEAEHEARWNKNSLEIQAFAATWIERRESDDWREADQAELDAWLAESPAHLVAYLRADDVWGRANRLRALNRPGRSNPDGTDRKSFKLPFLRIAAAFVVILVIGALAAGYFALPKQQTYATTIGGHETLTLDDGSQIELNTNTTVRVAYDSSQRNIWLDKGEAYFHVAHDSAHPFVVTLGNVRVVDLGTKFLIRRESDRVEVALLEGKARFEDSVGSPQLRQTTLTPGDVVMATANSVSLVRKSPQNLTNQLGWRRGMLVFDQATLADVAGEYNRYNRQKIVIADAATGRLTISGTLPTNDIGAFTRVARKFFNLRVEKLGNEVVVSR
jgi:transmembrane sensor